MRTNCTKIALSRIIFFSVSVVSVTPAVDCLTCGPGPGLPAPCGHAAAEVSPDCSAYVLRCGGPGVPYTATLALPANQVRCIELETKARRRFAKI